MNLTNQQTKIYKKLNTPAKVQDFLDTLKINFEEKGETCRGPLGVLQTKKAHCMEAALLAASILRFHGHKPLLMDLRARRPDVDHIVTLFKVRGFWGGITKTNHAVLRYREPIYRTLRELALSFFHEYFDNKTGIKNLREYSVPMNLTRFDHLHWETSLKDQWEINQAMDDVRHYWLVNPSQVKHFRKADKMEIKAGKLVEWL